MSLTQREIEQFREILLKMKKQLGLSLRAVSHDVKATEESKGYSQHQADEGTDSFSQTVSIQVSTKEQEIVRQN